MFFTLGTRFGTTVTQRKQLYVCCWGQLGQGYAASVWCVYTHVHVHTYVQLKEQGPCFLAMCFFSVISTLSWSPRCSVLSLVSLWHMGKEPSSSAPGLHAFLALGLPAYRVLLDWGPQDSLLWVENDKQDLSQVSGWEGL